MPDIFILLILGLGFIICTYKLIVIKNKIDDKLIKFCLGVFCFFMGYYTVVAMLMTFTFLVKD